MTANAKKLDSSVLDILESSPLSNNEKIATFQEAVKTAESASIEGYREVMTAAHKVGLTAGKARAKKDLLGKLKDLTAEEMFARAFARE